MRFCERNSSIFIVVGILNRLAFPRLSTQRSPKTAAVFLEVGIVRIRRTASRTAIVQLREESAPRMIGEASTRVGVLEDSVCESTCVTLHHHEHDLSVRWETIEPAAELARRHLLRIPKIERRVVWIRPRLIVAPSASTPPPFAAVTSHVNDHAIARLHLPGQISKVLLDLIQLSSARQLRNFVIAINEIGRLRVAKQFGQHAPRRRTLFLEGRIAILQIRVRVFAIGKPYIE